MKMFFLQCKWAKNMKGNGGHLLTYENFNSVNKQNNAQGIMRYFHPANLLANIVSLSFSHSARGGRINFLF